LHYQNKDDDQKGSYEWLEKGFKDVSINDFHQPQK
tara:strand:+ start:55363 stop:55467 length:105 start_codon:yes stop_codon:yes gene_type:complete